MIENMNISLRLKLLRFGSYLATLLWITSGFVTIVSIFLSHILVTVNIVVGILFILIGLYVFFKEKIFTEFLIKTSHNKEDRIYKKVIFGEIIFIISTLCIGLVIFSAVSSRVFIEGFAVFG